MSEHYSHQEYAGCTGCVVIALVVATTVSMTLLAVAVAVCSLLSLVG